MGIKYWSQNGQDKWVLETLGYKKNGFFLDSGAYYPKDLSNTYTLEKYFGWTGICIEPLSHLYQKLCEERTCIVLQGILDKKIREAGFIEEDGYSGILEYMCEQDKNVLHCMPQYNGRDLKQFVKMVPTLLISDILKKYKAPKIIDYWSLDVEGAELPILESFPWNDHEVTLLTVEHNTGEPHCSDTRKFMTNLGYKIFPTLLSPNEDHFQKI